MNLDVLVPGGNHWKKVSDMPKTGGYWAAAALPGHVYLVGGGPPSQVLSDTCLRYDFPTNEWFEVSLSVISHCLLHHQHYLQDLLYLGNSCFPCSPPFPCGLMHKYCSLRLAMHKYPAHCDKLSHTHHSISLECHESHFMSSCACK